MIKDRNWYRYAEHALYNHMRNLDDLAKLKAALGYLISHGDLSSSGLSATFRTSGGEVSDRVCDYVHRVHVIERKIARIEAETCAVSSVYARATEQERAVIEGIYFAGVNAYEWEGLTCLPDLPACRWDSQDCQTGLTIGELKGIKRRICYLVWRGIVRKCYGRKVL